jgi:hypothetical protein
MTDVHQPEPTAVEKAAAPRDEHFSDAVVLLGRKITVYGGIYTVVFIALGILTAIEVTLGVISGNWTIPLLMAIADQGGAGRPVLHAPEE